jgi:tryptophan synthase alpha chain
MGRIDNVFADLKTQGKTGIIAYVTVGYPDVDATRAVVPAIIEAGADMIELGVPFSDPLADGPTVQRSSQAALLNGVTLETCLEVCGELRERLPLVPLILMPYYNPILAYGVNRFAESAQAAGVDGVIVPDLPPEEAGPLLEACRPHGIEVIFLLAPTTTDARMETVARSAGGFIYCVSLNGVTGVRSDLPAGLPNFLERVRRHTDIPLAVGFGVSTGEHVRLVGKNADAAIIGSALIQMMEQAEPDQCVERVREFVAGLRSN